MNGDEDDHMDDSSVRTGLRRSMARPIDRILPRDKAPVRSPASAQAMPWEARRAPTALAPLQSSIGGPAMTMNANADAIEVGRNPVKGGSRIARALRHMSENHDLPLTVAELAGIAGLSIPDFCDRFVAAVGRSPRDHLVHLRVEEAQAALLETDLDFGSVALLCGFRSRDDLCACFEAQVGASPSDWRAARR